MGISLLQKIKLAFRGWQRRREESEKDFVAKNIGWAGGQAPPPVAAPSTGKTALVLEIDVEGLQVAYLDDSGRLVHYLDTTTGEVVDERAEAAPLAAPRYRRVPSRTSESDAEDRRAFVATRELSAALDRVARAVDDADAFRAALAADRALERAWYSFKNDRALAVVKEWLR